MKKLFVFVSFFFLLVPFVVGAAAGDVSAITEPLNKIYDLLKAVVSIVAVLAITFAGVRFMFSGDDLKARELFSGVLSGFGLLHARVFLCLLSGEVKTARQLSEEAFVSYNKVYSVLRDLIKERLVECSNASPVNYYVVSPLKAFERLVNKRIVLLERKPLEFSELISSEPEGIQEREYLIKFNETQTRLIDNKNKALVREPIEARQIIKKLNGYIDKLEPKKEYVYAVYR